MHVAEVLSRHRNDYVAMMECKYCGHKWRNGAAYADAFYAYRVIPAMHCSECRKNEAGELGTGTCTDARAATFQSDAFSEPPQ